MGYGQSWRGRVERDKKAGLLSGYEMSFRLDAADLLRAEMGSRYDELPDVDRRRMIVDQARKMMLRDARPTERQLIAWWEDQPEREYRCERCEKAGPKTQVQPQHPYYAEGREGVSRCAECVAQINADARARKAGAVRG